MFNKCLIKKEEKEAACQDRHLIPDKLQSCLFKPEKTIENY